MSEPAHDRRECRECGAQLSSWYCDVCGGFSLKAASKVSLSEFVMPWARGGGEARAMATPAQVATLN